MSDRLHVLLVSAWYPTPDNPVEGLFVRDQARAVSVSCDVTVLSRAMPSLGSDVSENGIRVLRVLPASGSGLITNVKRLLAINAALRRLRREGHPPDLIHAHVYYAAFLAVLIGRTHRLPVVVSEHDTHIVEGRLSRRDRAIARITFRLADMVCPVSALLERSLSILEPRGRYVVVQNAVDVEAFATGARRTHSSSSPRLLTVSGLFRGKGIPYLFEALGLLLSEYPTAHLEIAGDGPERNNLVSLAEGLPVAFLGSCSRDDVKRLMDEADILVMSSVVETFGIAPLEALASGLAVVATTAFPVADVISDLGGVIVPPSNPLALRDAIASVLAGERRVRSDASVELSRRFGLGATGRRWEEIYRSVVTSPSRNWHKPAA